MRSSLVVSLGLAGLSIASALPNLATKRSGIAKLPEGFFSGKNNPDGTTTLTYEDGQVFTYEPASVPAVEARDTSPVEKRVPFGQMHCWTFQPELNHEDVDYCVAHWRGRLRAAPMWLGHGTDQGISMSGFSIRQTIVYFCYNTRDPSAMGSIFERDLDFATLWTDRDCGAYQPGYFQWESPMLFGKTWEGTPICLGP